MEIIFFSHYIMETIQEPKIKKRMTPFNRMGLGYIDALLGRAEKRGDLAEAEQCRAEIERRKKTKVERANNYLEAMKNKITKTGVLSQVVLAEPAPCAPEPEPETTHAPKPKRVRKIRKPNAEAIPVPAISDAEFVDNVEKMKFYIKHYLKSNPALNNMKFSFQL